MTITNILSMRLAKSQLPALENLLSIHLEFTNLKRGLLSRGSNEVVGEGVIPVT